jgi:hypothetical protein
MGVPTTIAVGEGELEERGVPTMIAGNDPFRSQPPGKAQELECAGIVDRVVETATTSGARAQLHATGRIKAAFGLPADQLSAFAPMPGEARAAFDQGGSFEIAACDNVTTDVTVLVVVIEEQCHRREENGREKQSGTSLRR